MPWLLQALRRLVDHPWVFHLVGEGSGSEKQQCLDLAALLAGIAEVEEHRQPDMEVVGRATAGVTWPQVFAKVEEVYERALLARKR